MPNNLVFNNVADQLKTQIYGYDGSNTQPISTDSSGRLQVMGTVTANTIGQFTQTDTTTSIASATVTVLTLDTSQQKAYTFYIFNQTANTGTVWLKVSPTDAASYFTDDQTAYESLLPNSKVVLSAKNYLQYTAFMLAAPAETITADIYYNALSL